MKILSELCVFEIIFIVFFYYLLSGFNTTSSETCRRVKKVHFVGDRSRNCTSLRPWPITSCQGVCFPQRELIGNALTYEKLLEQSRLNYKCVADKVVRKKVKIYCSDDQSLTQYRIPVVKTCKCVRLNNNANSVFGISKETNDPITKETRLFRQQMLKLKKVFKIK